MLFYYCFFFSILTSVVLLFIHSFVMMKRNIPVKLFVEALRDENSGHFEEALIAYEMSLNEFKKIRSHSNLKNKIIEKLKVLRTVIEYKNNLRHSDGANETMPINNHQNL
jgi:hypothetical protein